MIVGGDIKVVEKGACDKIFINTTGMGVVRKGLRISAGNARPGDCVIINGTVGDHGAAVMSARKDYKMRTSIRSDCACLNTLIERVLQASSHVHAMRDPTRGGVATTLKEIALQSNVEIILEEDLLPFNGAVRGFSELLGIDPLYMANEGKVLVFAPERDSGRIISAIKNHPLGKQAAVIGRVTRHTCADETPHVLLHTAIGSTRIIDMLSGEQLPRIC